MPKYLKPVTPAEISSHVKQICQEIAPGNEPFYVNVAPLEGVPANECFHVVNNHVAVAGGERVLGWAIWEVPEVFVEGEFHAVWKSPAGDFLDLTPKNQPASRIFFLLDESRIYEGRPLSNVRRAISRSPVVKSFFAALDRRYEIMNRGGRAYEHGEIALEGAELKEYVEIERQVEDFGLRTFSLHPNLGPYLPCPCNSGKKAKWCHPDVYREA